MKKSGRKGQNASPARKRLNISQDRWDYPRTWAPDEIRAVFGPARTLGANEDVRVAMDAQLESDGVYTLLQHSLQMGQMPGLQCLGYGMLQSMTQNGLIRACVETVSDDMTREWITLQGGSNLEEMNQLLADFPLQQIFHDACALVGYEGGAFIFIDTGADGEQLELPLRPSAYSSELAPGTLRFVVIDPVNVFPGEYNSLNPLRQDYFNPASWWVLGQRIHASRLIRLVANEVPVLLKPSYNFLGMAQAQLLWDYVLHFQECREAVARLLTKFSLTVFKTNMEAQITGAAAWDDFNRRIASLAQYRDNDGILAIDSSEDVIKLESPLSGVTEIVRQALEFLAALNRTPAVKLLGISPSGFNATGESDIRNYYDHIRSQQEKVLRRGIQRCLDFIMAAKMGGIDKELSFEFNELGVADQAALSTVQKTKADTIAVFLDRDVISPEEARKAIAEDPDSGFSFIDPTEVPARNNMPTPENDDVDKAGAVYDWMNQVGDEAFDAERWVTVHPNGRENTGQPALIDEDTGVVKGGMGGKFNGRNISDVSKKSTRTSQNNSSAGQKASPTSRPRKGQYVAKTNEIDPAKSVRGDDAHFAASANLRDEEIGALNLYSSDKGIPPPYKAINQGLRSKSELDIENKKAVHSMDTAFKRAKTTEQILSYRGIGDATILGDLKLGDTFIDNGFTSVSTDQRTAESFVGKSGVLLEVIIPKGSRAISMTDSFGLKSEYPEEKEILLDRGGSYTIKNIKNENGFKTITVVYNDRGEE